MGRQEETTLSVSPFLLRHSPDLPSWLPRPPADSRIYCRITCLPEMDHEEHPPARPPPLPRGRGVVQAKRRLLIWAAFLLLILFPLWAGLRFVYWVGWGSHRHIQSRQHLLVYGLNPGAILAAAPEIRQNASTYRQDPTWNNVPAGTFRYPDPNDPALPAAIKALKPSSIIIETHSVRIEMGGGFFHYGVIAYPPGIRGHGLKELTPGLWYYADDHRIPAP